MLQRITGCVDAKRRETGVLHRRHTRGDERDRKFGRPRQIAMPQPQKYMLI